MLLILDFGKGILYLKVIDYIIIWWNLIYIFKFFGFVVDGWFLVIFVKYLNMCIDDFLNW